MPRSTDWTRNETLAAFHIYLQLPFGQLHRNQPRIVQLSQWIGRTASAVAMKLVNLASLDPQIVASGRRGMGNASKLDKAPSATNQLSYRFTPICASKIEANTPNETSTSFHLPFPESVGTCTSTSLRGTTARLGLARLERSHK